MSCLPAGVGVLLVTFCTNRSLLSFVFAIYTNTMVLSTGMSVSR